MDNDCTDPFGAEVRVVEGYFWDDPAAYHTITRRPLRLGERRNPHHTTNVNRMRGGLKKAEGKPVWIVTTCKGRVKSLGTLRGPDLDGSNQPKDALNESMIKALFTHLLSSCGEADGELLLLRIIGGGGSCRDKDWEEKKDLAKKVVMNRFHGVLVDCQDAPLALIRIKIYETPEDAAAALTGASKHVEKWWWAQCEAHCESLRARGLHVVAEARLWCRDYDTAEKWTR